MTRQLASAAAVVILILAVATGSNALLDRYNVAAVASGSTCVGADGAKHNWPWANAPTLWPECPPDPTAAGAATQGK